MRKGDSLLKAPYARLMDWAPPEPVPIETNVDGVIGVSGARG